VIRPGGQFAYVSCDQRHPVAAIQANHWSVKLIDAGRGADGLTWAKGLREFVCIWVCACGHRKSNVIPLVCPLGP
jgi:hypothetical protein